MIWARSKFEQVLLSRKRNHKEMKYMIFLLRFVSFHLSCNEYFAAAFPTTSKSVSTSFYLPSYPFYFPSEFILPRMCFNGANPGNYLVQQREAPI